MSVHNIILIGSTGVGKTSTGFELAHFLNLGFFDTDLAISRRKKMSLEAIFQTSGEEEFRRLECECFESISSAKSMMISTGAGFVAHNDNLKKLKTIGLVVWLKIPASHVALRLLADKSLIEKRPLLKDVLTIKDIEAQKAELTQRLQVLSDQRLEYYRQADIEVDGSFLSQSTLVRAIAEKINHHTKAG